MAEDNLPTHHPAFNVNDQLYQSRRDCIETTRFHDAAIIDAFQHSICEAYRSASQARLIQLTTLAALKVYHTQQAVADIIGIDRSCISVAKDHGELGSGPLAALFFNPRVFALLMEHCMGILRDMGRHGFIAAARQTYAIWYGRDAVELSVAKYEELCQRMPATLADDRSEPEWRDVFVYVFATVEGIDDSPMW
jgi:hypothetical protein